MGSKVSKKGGTGRKASAAWVRDSLSIDDSFKGLLDPKEVESRFAAAMETMSAKDAAFVRSEVRKIMPLDLDSKNGGEAFVYSGEIYVSTKTRTPENTASIIMHEAVHAGRGSVPDLMPSGRPYLSNVTKRQSKLWRETEVFTTEVSLRHSEAALVRILKVEGPGSERGMRVLDACANQIRYRASMSYGTGKFDPNVRRAGCKWDVEGPMTANKDAFIQDLVKNGFAGHKQLGLALAKEAGWKE